MADEQRTTFDPQEAAARLKSTQARLENSRVVQGARQANLPSLQRRLSYEANTRFRNAAEPQLAALQNRLDTFERSNPEFSRYARGAAEQLQEDGVEKTAERIKDDANALVEGLEGRSLLGRASLYFDALKAGYKLADKLDDQIAKGKRGGWMIAVALAILKDLFDYLLAMSALIPGPTIVFGPVTDMVITLFFFSFFFWFLWGKGTFVFRFIMRRVGAAFLLEFIPFLNMFPFYTVTILYTWWKVSNKMAELDQERGELRSELGKLEQTAAQG